MKATVAIAETYRESSRIWSWRRQIGQLGHGKLLECYYKHNMKQTISDCNAREK